MNAKQKEQIAYNLAYCLIDARMCESNGDNAGKEKAENRYNHYRDLLNNYYQAKWELLHTNYNVTVIKPISDIFRIVQNIMIKYRENN